MCRGTVAFSILAGFLAGAISADLIDEMRRDFQLGIFGRQQQEPLNLQRFQGPFLGDLAPPQIMLNDGPDSDQKPFKIVGGGADTDGKTLPNFEAAGEKACGRQKNDCADARNKKENTSYEVPDCDKQNEDCTAANKLDDQDGEFFYFCDD